MKNANLDMVAFTKIPEDHQTAFGKGTVRVVTLPRGFQIFKLTAGKIEETKYGITPWWSPMKPYAEDKEGALGRFVQANMNGIDMSAMVRFMSAVCVDWNDLDNYAQVSLTDDTMAFWGTFAPQKLFSKDQADPVAAAAKAYNVNGGAELPPDLGTLEAWQLYVPSLRDADIRREALMPAHNMALLAMHFGVGMNEGKRPGQISKL